MNLLGLVTPVSRPDKLAVTIYAWCQVRYNFSVTIYALCKDGYEFDVLCKEFMFSFMSILFSSVILNYGIIFYF